MRAEDPFEGSAVRVDDARRMELQSERLLHRFRPQPEIAHDVLHAHFYYAIS